jgi:tetratricopeptide (TPR) repeat protein
MLLKWLKAEEATQVGTALADALVFESSSVPVRWRAKAAQHEAPSQHLPTLLQKFLQRVDREARPLRLNVFKRATLANSFKWRLLEKGIERQIVDELTQALVVRLSANRGDAVAATGPVAAAASAGEPKNTPSLFARGNARLERGAYAEAVECFQELLRLEPQHATARNNLGAAFCRLGRYEDAQEQFRHAVASRRDYWDAHRNLGTVLRWRGRLVESEAPLRQALKLKPTDIDAQLSLSATLLLLSHSREAKALLENVLKRAPRNVAALVGLAQIAGPEGRFAEAESLFKRAIEIDPQAQAAWAGLVWLRKMTPADRTWLARRGDRCWSTGAARGSQHPLRDREILRRHRRLQERLSQLPARERAAENGSGAV